MVRLCNYRGVELQLVEISLDSWETVDITVTQYRWLIHFPNVSLHIHNMQFILSFALKFIF